jgi:hypothetical protein
MPSIAIPDSPPALAPTTLGGKLLNNFVCPGDVFDEVLAAPSRATNWRVPTLLVCLTGIILLQVVAIYGERADALASSVQYRGITAAQAQELSGVWPLVSSLGVCLGAFAGVFWSAFVVWFIGRVFLKARFTFLKALEIVGLSSIILVLGVIVTALLIAARGDVAAHPALSLFASQSGRRIHGVLETLNFFHLWSTGVLAIGLSRLSGAALKEAAFWVFGYWILARIALILLA